MRIGIDIDGVTNDLHKPWLELYNKESGDNLTVEDLTQFDVTKSVRPGWRRKMYDLLNTENLFRNAPMQEGAYHGIMSLIANGHSVYFVSAFYPYVQGCVEKTKWLESVFPDFKPYLNEMLIFTKAKYMIDVDVLIDDCERNLVKFIDHKSNRYAFLFDQPWNKNLEKPEYEEKFYRVKWNNALNTINSLEGTNPCHMCGATDQDRNSNPAFYCPVCRK